MNSGELKAKARANLVKPLIYVIGGILIAVSVSAFANYNLTAPTHVTGGSVPKSNQAETIAPKNPTTNIQSQSEKTPTSNKVTSSQSSGGNQSMAPSSVNAYQAPTCNESLKTLALQDYNNKIAQENLRHDAEVTSLTNIYSARGMLDSTFAQAQIAAENSKHGLNLQSLATDYSFALVKIYCKN